MRYHISPEKVKALRVGRGLTQAELAPLAGLLRANLARIESGQRTNPTFETACKLADALGVTVDQLRG